MGQLLTLMVFGDMVAADADNTQQPQRQPQQSTAGRSTEVTQYRVRQHDDDDEVEYDDDDEGSSAHYTMSMDMGPMTRETSCSGGNGSIDDRHHNEESSTDGAGH